MKSIYRIEHPTADEGLWYSRDGCQTNFIVNRVKNALCRDMPMGFNQNIVGGWISAAETVEQMNHWISLSDALQLSDAGFEMFEVQVPEYRHEYGHVVFRREDAIFLPMSFEEFDLR